MHPGTKGKAGRPPGPKKVKVQAWVVPEKAERFREMLRSGECPECPEGAPNVGSGNEERVKRLQEENKRLDKSLAARESEAIEMRGEIAKLKAERGAESNPSVFAVENMGLKKKIKELEQKIRVLQDDRMKPAIVTGSAAGIDQAAMWKKCADDFEKQLNQVNQELSKLRKWHETADIDAKCKKGWQMYYMLKEGQKRNEYDQEAGT